ncbi:MAG: hypothetical protein GYB66_10975 [Chloroflexi bacterium]|nr:hypothetical protein [Chloroflexota bacterium]
MEHISTNPRLWIIIGLVGLIIIFVAIHIIWYIRPSNIESTAALDAELTNGEPTIISFYSNF